MITIKTNRLKVSLASAIFGIGLATAASGADFSYNSVLPVYLQLDKTLLPEDIVDGYMETYRPEVWAKYRYDEFELEEKRQESLQIMKEWIAAAKPDDVFVIQTRFEFGEYDFQSEKFEFRPLADNLYFTLDQCCSDLPRRIKVFFANPEIANGIPMPKAQAKEFLNARKSSYGSIDRTVLAKISIRMHEVRSRGELVSKIENIHIFDREGRVLIATLDSNDTPSQ